MSPADPPDPKSPPAEPAPEKAQPDARAVKEAKLAEALRANLRRRKGKD